ncbi:MAG: SGNH/GDSL hydrolase family protein [Planctomycetes bacterium]|nr:SGNH/GDSL hydrolase family protein [Planctomycetota bacterium]
MLLVEQRTLVLLVLAGAAMTIQWLGLQLARRQPRAGRAAALRRGVIAGGMALSLLYAALEFTCGVLLVRSDGFAHTIAGRLWMREHWRPINRLGFRDREPPALLPEGRQVLVVLGDSLAAGFGVDDCEDRFGDRLQAGLGEEWLVVNVARSGWDTSEELRALREYPLRPDVVVFAYCLNDIDGAAARCGLTPPRLVDPPPRWARFLIDHSYTLNHLYWRWVRFRDRRIEETYWQHLLRCHERDDVRAEHEQELRALIRVCREADCRLLAVVFPHLSDLKRSRRPTRRIIDLLTREAVPAIDLTETLKGRSPSELTVNRLDPHAGVPVHREVAELVREALREAR